MKHSHYLPIKFKLGGHYEIVKVLGEDDFEILYLVKDLHMGEKLFVLKELFLPSYSSRNKDNTLHVMAKSKQIFEQTKKDIISEIEVLKNTQQSESLQLYGYFEENDTVYTIMEFINDANLSSYLELNNQKRVEEKVVEEETSPPEIILPSLEETIEPVVESSDLKPEKKKPKSTIFLKALIVGVLIMVGLAFYSYNMIQEDRKKAKEKSEKNLIEVRTERVTMPHPTLETKSERVTEEENQDEIIKETIEEKSIQDIPIKEATTLPEDAKYIDPSEIEIEVQNDVLEGVPKEEIYQDSTPPKESRPAQQETVIFEEEITVPTQHEQVIFEEEIFSTPRVIKVPPANPVKPNISLGTRIN